jgi:hypothetical protein
MSSRVSPAAAPKWFVYTSPLKFAVTRISSRTSIGASAVPHVPPITRIAVAFAGGTAPAASSVHPREFPDTFPALPFVGSFGLRLTVAGLAAV